MHIHENRGLDKTRLQQLIPHDGAMCLLDAVTAWDDFSIVCMTNSHRDPANPLRRDGRLAAVHAFEYGAQAAAVHGGLCAESSGRAAPPGYLAAVREARWFVAELDAVAEPLDVSARQLLGDIGHCIYAIQVRAAGRLLAEARITIVPRGDP